VSQISPDLTVYSCVQPDTIPVRVGPVDEVVDEGVLVVEVGVVDVELDPVLLLLLMPTHTTV
jgi:hypothetical protein